MLYRIHKKVKMEIIDYRDKLKWNPRRGHWAKRDLNKVNKIILHQELGAGNTESVHNYHTSKECHVSPGRGTPKICYHYVIEFDGSIKWVNDLDDNVWHTKGQNSTGIGIMLQGDFDGPNHNGKNEPTEEQEKSYYYLAEYLMNKLNLSIDDLYRHADFGKPACPGDIASQWVVNLKNQEA